MLKPASLRDHLTNALPDLACDPEKLMMLVAEGSIQSTLNRPGFPRRLGASGSDAAQTLQAAGRQHWNDDVWGYRTFRCS